MYMDTIVTVEVVGPPGERVFRSRTAAAFSWFAEVERRCSRFDPDSEVMRLCSKWGEPVLVSDLVYRCIEFALAVADATEGAFDPTLGGIMEAKGFNVNYLTGEKISSNSATRRKPCYRDVVLDPVARTITLVAPLTLDLGAVAKGFAIDLAVRELAPFRNYVINAGGDIWAAGSNERGEPWHIGIRDSRHSESVASMLLVSDAAVCTSGGYERPRDDGENGHHIIESITTQSPTGSLSATVIGPSAMVADALSTAAFVLGPDKGIAFLSAQHVEGIITGPSLRHHCTPGFARWEFR